MLTLCLHNELVQMLRHGFHSFPPMGGIVLHHLKEAMNLIGRYLRSEN